MESNIKRRGFIKGKLVMTFYKAPKPATSSMQYSSKVKPSTSTSKTASVGYVYDNNEFVIPSRKVSFVKTDGNGADESVDMKAASYISSVQERFKLEQLERAQSIRRNHQEAQYSAKG